MVRKSAVMWLAERPDRRSLVRKDGVPCGGGGESPVGRLERPKSFSGDEEERSPRIGEPSLVNDGWIEAQVM